MAKPVGPYASEWPTLTQIIDIHARNAPRSRQKAIGPSEIGIPCDHCLAAALAGWEATQGDLWQSTLGTAGHAWLAEAMASTGNKLAGHERWLTEKKLYVGDILNRPVFGTGDLYDTDMHAVVDWKIPGKTSIQQQVRETSIQYRVQVHLYGRGYAHAGYQVDMVALALLPAGAPSGGGYLWSEDYDPALADYALHRANVLAEEIMKARGELKHTGYDNMGVREYVTGLDRADGCFMCDKYPDRQLTRAMKKGRP